MFTVGYRAVRSQLDGIFAIKEPAADSVRIYQHNEYERFAAVFSMQPGTVLALAFVVAVGGVVA
jgi:hypothetical protein